MSSHAGLFGMAESRICRLHAQTVALLRNYLWRLSEPVSGCCSEESDPLFYTSANGYVFKEITEISGYANVAPPRAGIKKGSGLSDQIAASKRLSPPLLGPFWQVAIKSWKRSTSTVIGHMTSRWIKP
jgi:hypothetical protein